MESGILVWSKWEDSIKMINSIVTGHDNKFKFLFRIQHIMQQYYNPSIRTYCIDFDDNLEHQFSDIVKYIKFDIPEYIHPEHAKQKLIISSQFCRPFLPTLVDHDVSNVMWMDADIIPLDKNSLTDMFTGKPTVTTPQQLNNLVNDFSRHIYNWYGFKDMHGINSGLISAPKNHKFWNLWQEEIKELYLKNLNRFFNDNIYYDQSDPTKDWNITAYGIPMVLFFIDQISLNSVYMKYPSMFNFMPCVYNQQPIHPRDESFVNPRSLDLNTKNVHLLSVFKRCLLTD